MYQKNRAISTHKLPCTAYCETDFKRCMLHLCKTTYRANLKCNSAAGIYYWGVTEFGDKSFQESQLEYCECVALTEVKRHYAQYVHHFYLAHLPSNASRWEDLTEAGPVSTHYMAAYSGTEAIDQFAAITKLVYGLHKGMQGRGMCAAVRGIEGV